MYDYIYLRSDSCVSFTQVYLGFSSICLYVSFLKAKVFMLSTLLPVKVLYLYVIYGRYSTRPQDISKMEIKIALSTVLLNQFPFLSLRDFS